MSLGLTLPYPLGSTFAPQVSSHVGTVWSVGIDGQGYLMSTLDQESPFDYRAYTIQAVPMSKPRIDDSEEPGEQTLFPWWTRAQHSWHEGSGQDIFDSPMSSRFKVKATKGIDVWAEEGCSFLLKDVELHDEHETATDLLLLGGSDALFYTHNGNITRDPDPDDTLESDEATITDHDGNPVNSITSDGDLLYLSFSSGGLGIRSVDMDGTFSGTSIVNDHEDVDIIGFVKGRLIGCKDNEVFDYDLSTTAIPSAHYTDEADGFRFTGITEAGPGIYLSGYAGDRSEIFIMRLTAQDITSGLTLGVPRSVWEAPRGEQIHSIKGYLGTSVLIGTSKGVRVGIVTTGDGDIEVSGLIVETDHPVKAITARGNFAWFTWTQYDGNSSGLGRIHLGRLNWAPDLMYNSSGTVFSVANYNDRMYFSVEEEDSTKIIKEHATRLVSEGTVRTGEIRFGTSETKSLRYFDIVTRNDGKWSLDIAVNGGSFVSYSADQPTGSIEEVINLDANRFDLQITLKRSESDDTVGPCMREWRLRAEPKATGRFRHILPLMIYDFMVGLNDVEQGYQGFAWYLLDKLTDLYRNDELVIFQTPATGVPGASPTTYEVKVEDLQFKTYTPPAEARGYGGIALIVLREAR